MIILLKTVQTCNQKKNQNKYKKMNNLDEEKIVLKILATDTHDNLIRTKSDDAIVDHLNL